MKTIKTIDKTINILDFISDNQDKYNLSSLSKKLDMPLTTLNGLILTLESHKLIKRNDNGFYELGSKILELYSKYNVDDILINRYHNKLVRLAELTNETCHLAKAIDDDSIIYIDKVESSHPVRLTSMVGNFDLKEETAIGFALDDDKKMYDEKIHYVITKNDITIYFRNEIELYAYCVAVKLEEDVAISVFVPKSRFDEKKLVDCMVEVI
ncbi:hypothetical protein SH1V18_13310 [Vallitalea longa]|uniref:HTH iclR-type domain-containing protein n=1 Tax=Vallitalea longa TaxID=2936439 RepID=A0A9W5Y9Z5_9FIRM|nr:helix-turn-helix domain-containing protein [Vallitalea longa]GKX28851.1 hypothetical protein SH1V18_13310 [Vallitalea longa]